MFRSIFIFFVILTTACSVNNGAEQRSLLIDAFDHGSWNGLVMLDQKSKQSAAFRFNSYYLSEGEFSYFAGKALDAPVSYANNGDSIYHHIKKVGLKSSNNDYASLQWQQKQATWHLQWGKTNSEDLYGQLVNDHANDHGLIVECYLPFEQKGIMHFENNQLKANTFHLLFDQQPTKIVSSSVPLKEEQVREFIEKGYAKSKQINGSYLYLLYSNINSLKFKLNNNSGLGWEQFDQLFQKLEAKTIKNRVRVSTAHGNVADALIDNLNWMRAYIPDAGKTYVPAGRTWDWGGWAIFEWDAFFNSLSLSIDNPALAKENLDALYWAQYENGNMPNYRCGDSGSLDHSQPPIGPWVVWKMYQRTNDISLLKEGYPKLKKWYDWWYAENTNGNPRRDGNKDGLFEWGADADKAKTKLKMAMYESGADDSPRFDSASYSHQTWTMNMNAIDLNCQMVSMNDHMAKIAKVIGLADSLGFESEKQRLTHLINAQLWDQQDQRYKDRYWDGQWSQTYGPEHFYPLFSGVASQQQADAIVKDLMNPDLFWGEYILPTVSKNDPRFPDQQYWRGSIWPPTNYLIFDGLVKYGYDSLATVFAEKSMAMYMRNLKEKQTSQENYDCRSGWGDGQKFQSWASLFNFMWLENKVVKTEEGYRFGNLDKGDFAIEDLLVSGKSFNLNQSKGHLNIQINNRDFLLSDVPILCKGFVFENNRLYGKIISHHFGEVKFPTYEATQKIKPGENIIDLKNINL
ncbi:amylo-alpha-1,6-glucosidase [Persicobacter psychrovividus]|uniref:Mannosylglycerate hydrolase MGH1-like glycoside hydrolase domain-containing protein n=1 Tax=Persicobacter psychrovividus TaxID=387638 RepID=A0ABN6LFQ1_9BACT|nr:hypothetical protein PEPS_42850 [Persicobacter psychrovividus]